jgi:hypothetical protein
VEKEAAGDEFGMLLWLVGGHGRRIAVGGCGWTRRKTVQNTYIRPGWRVGGRGGLGGG